MSVGIRKSSMPLAMKLRIFAIVTVLLALVGAGLWWWLRGWRPSPAQYPDQGVTLSAENGEINWHALVKRGAGFAYIHASTGAATRDPAFARNWADARAAGLRYGAVLVYDPCRAAGDQATQFITTVPRDNAALPPVVQFGGAAACTGGPPPRDRILSELNTLINLVEAHSGKPALIRLSQDFERRYQISAGINRTLWLERDFLPPDYAARPWVMWTANHARRVVGMDNRIEWDVVAP